MGADDLTSTLIEGESLSGFIEAGAGEESGLVLFLSWEKQGNQRLLTFIRTPFPLFAHRSMNT